MKSKTNPVKVKKIRNALSKRIERFDIMKSIAQAPVGLTIGQIVRGDAEGLRSEVRKILSGKVRDTALAIHSENVPQRPQAVRVQAYSEDTLALLDSGAISNVMSISMVEILNLKLKPTQRSIKVANETTGVCSGVSEQVPSYSAISSYISTFSYYQVHRTIL